MKKFLGVLVTVCCITIICILGIAIINNGNNNKNYEDEPQYKIYKLAVENGYEDSYENWLESVSGREVLLRVYENCIQWKYDSETIWNTLISLEEFAGVDGKDGREVIFQVVNNQIQWKYSGDDSWINLFDLNSLVLVDEAKKINFRVGNGFIQWQYDGEENWCDLISLDTLKGDTGNGISSIKKTSTDELIDTYTITYTDGTTTTFTVTNGKDGAQGIQGIQGVPGKDGHTPVITIQDGYWYIDGENSNVSASGLKGDIGNGISSIKKTSTDELVDTYTITYTDGTTTTFTVTNGKDGAQGIQGIQGVPGKDGHTPVITIQDGYWYIDGVSTGVVAVGIRGPQGEPGVSVVNAYIDTELHLILVLSNGQTIDAGYVGIEVKPSEETFTVTFLDYDGTVLDSQLIKKGDSATAPSSPTREGYVFTGWDTDFSSVNSNLVINALYQLVENSINVLNIEYEENGDNTLTVKLSIGGDIVNYVGMDGYLSYDSSKLTFISCSKESELSGSINNVTDDGKVYISLAGNKDVKESELILTATFEYNGSLMTDVDLIIEDIFDSGFNTQEYSVIGGTIVIE